MGLTRYRLGDLIEKYDERVGNPDLTVNDVSGVNRDKEFFEPSKQVGANTSKYKVVPVGYFATNLMHVGRDIVLPVAFNHSHNKKVVSPAYTVFKVKDNVEIFKEYLFMYLNSEEKDRYFWFFTDASIRDGLSWEDFCDIEIDLPPLAIQKKYVDVYKALLGNQEAYETGLEDLRLAADAIIEELKYKKIYREVGEFIRDVNVRNEDESVTLAQGVNVDKVFIPAKRVAANIKNTKVVKEGQFAYNKVMKANGTLLPIALRKGRTCFVSSSYQVFEIYKPEELNSEYLMLWLTRLETQRYAGYISWGSTRDTISFETFCEIRIPVPSLKVQNSIANIYSVYRERKQINEKLKQRLKNICPILIKGAVEEASRKEV